MKKVGSDAISAAALSIDPQRRVNNFEIFGLDFMIDENYNVWLIEINTNPCLETTCPVLSKIIPRFIENTFQYSLAY
jgi:tubulin monoglycylase TTLL3/8